MKKLSMALMLIILLAQVDPCSAADSLASQANLRFSHKTHEQNSVSCIQCHIDSEESFEQTPPDLPPGWQPLRNSKILATDTHLIKSEAFIDDSFGRPGEDRCLKCHFGSREKSDCALCHLSTPGETKRERARLGDLYNFSHQKHGQFDCARCHHGVTDWETLDGNKISAHMEDCLECHNGDDVPKNCVMCHSPTPRPLDHTRNYEKKHGIAYRADPQHCNMCHEQSSCIECHSQKPRNHTLAWVRHRHGIAARTNPMKCQACHSDPWVCARCHNNDGKVPW